MALMLILICERVDTFILYNYGELVIYVFF